MSQNGAFVQLQAVHLLNLQCNVPVTCGSSVIAEPLVCIYLFDDFCDQMGTGCCVKYLIQLSTYFLSQYPCLTINWSKAKIQMTFDSASLGN